MDTQNIISPWVDVLLEGQEPGASARSLEMLGTLGYSRVCWCSESTGRLDGLREPVRPAASHGSVQQLARLNVHVEEEQHVSHIHTSRDLLRAYDLIAVVPHSEAALERCLQPPAVDHIDIISLPSAQRLPFTLKPVLVQRAVRAGLHFELCYSAALRDGLSRRNLVSNLQAVPSPRPSTSPIHEPQPKGWLGPDARTRRIPPVLSHNGTRHAAVAGAASAAPAEAAVLL